MTHFFSTHRHLKTDRPLGHRRRPFVVRQLFAAIATLSAMLTLNGCKDDTDNPTEKVTIYNIVELTSKTSASTVFSLWTPNATEPITLTSSSAINTGDTAVGECVYLAYTTQTGKADVSDNITVSAYGTIMNDKLKQATLDKIAGWDTDAVNLLSLWRAGNNVCMRMKLTYDATARVFALVVDESTLTEAYPTAYLYNKRQTDNDNFERQYYAAFNLSALWTHPNVEGLKIIVNNSNMPQLNEFTIENPHLQSTESN
jgi:hypothetical protein